MNYTYRVYYRETGTRHHHVVDFFTLEEAEIFIFNGIDEKYEWWWIDEVDEDMVYKTIQVKGN